MGRFGERAYRVALDFFGNVVMGDYDNRYLERHGLTGARFPSRARAVDAVRLALQSEPRGSGPQTQWVKQREGEYLSRDGHWRLRRDSVYACLEPFSPACLTAFSAPGSIYRSHVRFSGPSGARTLLECARRADYLNQQLGL